MEVRTFDKRYQTLLIVLNPKNQISGAGAKVLQDICSVKDIKCRTIEIYDEQVLANTFQYHLSIQICRMNGDTLDYCKDLKTYEKIKKFLLSIK